MNCVLEFLTFLWQHSQNFGSFISRPKSVDSSGNEWEQQQKSTPELEIRKKKITLEWTGFAVDVGRSNSCEFCSILYGMFLIRNVWMSEDSRISFSFCKNVSSFSIFFFVFASPLSFQRVLWIGFGWHHIYIVYCRQTCTQLQFHCIQYEHRKCVLCQNVHRIQTYDSLIMG